MKPHSPAYYYIFFASCNDFFEIIVNFYIFFRAFFYDLIVFSDGHSFAYRPFSHDLSEIRCFISKFFYDVLDDAGFSCACRS